MSDVLDYRAMGERVQRRRRALKLTQQALAGQVNVSTSFIGHIERGEKKASAETIVALCRSLGVSADYLMRGVENRCDQQDCELYRAMTEVLSRYGRQ